MELPVSRPPCRCPCCCFPLAHSLRVVRVAYTGWPDRFGEWLCASMLRRDDTAPPVSLSPSSPGATGHLAAQRHKRFRRLLRVRYGAEALREDYKALKVANEAAAAVAAGNATVLSGGGSGVVATVGGIAGGRSSSVFSQMVRTPGWALPPSLHAMPFVAQPLRQRPEAAAYATAFATRHGLLTPQLTRPTQGQARDRCLALEVGAAMLLVEAALPRGALESHWVETAAARKWAVAVAFHATRDTGGAGLGLMECLVVLEDALKHAWLLPVAGPYLRSLPSRAGALAGAMPLSSVVSRLAALDAAMQYDKVLDLDASSTRGVGSAGQGALFAFTPPRLAALRKATGTFGTSGGGTGGRRGGRGRGRPTREEVAASAAEAAALAAEEEEAEAMYQ